MPPGGMVVGNAPSRFRLHQRHDAGIVAQRIAPRLDGPGFGVALDLDGVGLCLGGEFDGRCVAQRAG